MKYLIINTKKYFDNEQFSRFIVNFNEYLNDDKIILACDKLHYDLIYNNSINLCFQSFDDFNSFSKEKTNIKYSLIGHKDDRFYKNENNFLINERIKILLKNDIIPILCVGEEIYEENLQKTLSTIFVQIDECMKDLSSKTVEKILFAYEPFWAISDGRSFVDVDIFRINDIIKEIKKKIKDKYSINPIVLYGGSINDKNIAQINTLEIEGLLIGAASTDKDILNKIFHSIT